MLEGSEGRKFDLKIPQSAKPRSGSLVCVA
jgi:hypothetical protein